MPCIDRKAGRPEIEIHLGAIRLDDHRKSEITAMAKFVESTLDHLVHPKKVCLTDKFSEQPTIEFAHMSYRSPQQ